MTAIQPDNAGRNPRILIVTPEYACFPEGTGSMAESRTPFRHTRTARTSVALWEKLLQRPLVNPI